VDRTASEVRLVDISLLPAARGGGTGTHLICALLEEAAGAGRPVRLHVARGNPALRLYARLGFRVDGDDGMYLAMTWDPPSVE
jgi:ribosomal protein S18 acetylase RimI-like enzyme